MCSTVRLWPTGGSIQEFYIPLNKNPAENETASYLISDLFSKNQMPGPPSALVWHVQMKKDIKTAYFMWFLDQNKNAKVHICFKSVSRLCLRLIICVSCRLFFRFSASSALTYCPCILPNRTPHVFLLNGLPLHVVSFFPLPAAALHFAFHLCSSGIISTFGLLVDIYSRQDAPSRCPHLREVKIDPSTHSQSVKSWSLVRYWSSRNASGVTFRCMSCSTDIPTSPTCLDAKAGLYENEGYVTDRWHSLSLNIAVDQICLLRKNRDPHFRGILFILHIKKKNFTVTKIQSIKHSCW